MDNGLHSVVPTVSFHEDCENGRYLQLLGGKLKELHFCEMKLCAVYSACCGVG